MLNKILAALPNVFGALVVVAFAFVIGKLVAGLVTNLLTGRPVPRTRRCTRERRTIRCSLRNGRSRIASTSLLATSARSRHGAIRAARPPC
jgi:hypothetical protein